MKYPKIFFFGVKMTNLYIKPFILLNHNCIIYQTVVTLYIGVLTVYIVWYGMTVTPWFLCLGHLQFLSSSGAVATTNFCHCHCHC